MYVIKLLLMLAPFFTGVYTGYVTTSYFIKQNELSSLHKQIELNQKTIEWSRAEIARLNEREDKVVTIVKEVFIESESSVNANRPSLDLDGVRRLNKIR